MEYHNILAWDSINFDRLLTSKFSGSYNFDLILLCLDCQLLWSLKSSAWLEFNHAEDLTVEYQAEPLFCCHSCFCYLINTHSYSINNYKYKRHCCAILNKCSRVNFHKICHEFNCVRLFYFCAGEISRFQVLSVIFVNFAPSKRFQLGTLLTFYPATFVSLKLIWDV